MARVKLGIDKIEELVAQKYLKQKDVEEFIHAYDFLMRVRNELHFQNARLTDILTLDSQPKVAWTLGYRQADTLRRVERFMQDYYKSAQAIFRIAKLIESRLALTIGLDPSSESESVVDSLKSSRFKKLQHVDGFVVRGGELVASSPEVFKEDPARLIRIFRHSQQLGCKIGFHLSELIRDSLDIGSELVKSNDAAISFKAIMAEVGGVYPVLALMHELGVLGVFIPEFQGLTCLVQHEYYHRYTADVHTLNTIKELDLVFTDPSRIASQYRDALEEERDRSFFYITLLLHDIGKAADHEMEGGHPAVGAELLKRYGEKGEVVHAAKGHHDDIRPEYIYTVLVAAADACSASRPGARRETLEKYVRRLEELETLACGFPGVEQALAVQAGREIRVIVNPADVNDREAAKLCRDLATSIEQSLTYPGEVKVTVLRETKVIEYAK